MKIIFLNTFFIVVLLGSSFSADGYGDTKTKSKNDALKNLSELFSVQVNSSSRTQKKISDNEFKTNIKTNLDVSSDITLPNVEYEIISRNNDVFKTKATVSQEDIISYMGKYKIFLENINKSNNKKSNEELEKTLSDIENIYKLFLVVDIKKPKAFIEFMENKHRQITSYLYDGVLTIANYKMIELYINEEKANANIISVESEKEHILKAYKKGYFSVDKKITLRTQERKTIDFQFIKKKKRYINLISDVSVDGFLNTYKIINDSDAKISFTVSYKIKEKDKGKYIKIITYGKLLIKSKNKKIGGVDYSYKKTCLSQKRKGCLKSSKKKLIKKLIKKALIRIDEYENK